MLTLLALILNAIAITPLLDSILQMSPSRKEKMQVNFYFISLLHVLLDPTLRNHNGKSLPKLLCSQSIGSTDVVDAEVGVALQSLTHLSPSYTVSEAPLGAGPTK